MARSTCEADFHSFTPDLAAVKWKLPSWPGANIAADLEFLAAHPVRQSNDESRRAGADLQPAADRRAR
jgi:hypothetical protein